MVCEHLAHVGQNNIMVCAHLSHVGQNNVMVFCIPVPSSFGEYVSFVLYRFFFFSFVRFLRTKKTAWELTDLYPKRKTPSGKGSSSTHNCCLKNSICCSGGRKIVSDLGPTSIAITSLPKRAFSADNYTYAHIENSANYTYVHLENN